jgi:hypothetical protein
MKVKPVLSLEIMRQIVQSLRQGEPSTMRRQMLSTLEQALSKMIEIESERPHEPSRKGDAA